MKLNYILKRYKELPVQVRASLWFLICSFLQKGIAMLTTPIFTRMLSTAEYGQYNVFNSWMGILTVFVTLRLSAGMYEQGLVKFEKEKRKFISSMQGLLFSLVLFWTVMYLLFREFWNRLFSLTTVQMLAMLLMMWLACVFEFWAMEQRVSLNYRKLVVLTLLVSVIRPVVEIVFVLYAEDKVLARILGGLLVELVLYVGLFLSQMLRGKQFFSSYYWKYALMFNIPLIPHYLSQTVLNTSDRIMITSMVGDSEAGIYSLAYTLSQVMSLVNFSLLSTLGPWIYRKIKTKCVGEIAGIAYIALILIAGVNLVLIAFAPELVMLFAPVEYLDAIWVIPPVAMSVFFMFCYDLFAKFQFYFEKSLYVLIASIIGAVLNILLNYLFIPVFGYYAAGYTTLFCYMLYVAAHYFFMRKVCKEYLDNVRVYDMKIIVGIAVIFMTIGFALMAAYQNTVIRYTILGLLLLGVFIKRNVIADSVKKILSLKKAE